MKMSAHEKRSTLSPSLSVSIFLFAVRSVFVWAMPAATTRVKDENFNERIVQHLFFFVVHFSGTHTNINRTSFLSVYFSIAQQQHKNESKSWNCNCYHQQSALKLQLLMLRTIYLSFVLDFNRSISIFFSTSDDWVFTETVFPFRILSWHSNFE